MIRAATSPSRGEGGVISTRLNRNVWLLFCCQALIQSSAVGQVAMSVLIGHALAANKSLATLPYAIQMLSSMLAALPAGMIFSRFGRKAGFRAGAVAAVVAVLTFAYGVWRQDFLIYCLGSVPMGIGFGIGQQYRFAAAEVAATGAHARAVSLVMAGGVIAAIVGPEIVINTQTLLSQGLFLGTYLCMLIPPLLVLGVLVVVDLPPPPRRAATSVSLGTIIARPTFVTAAIAGLVAYGSMNIVMAAVPLQMQFCGFGVAASVHVIQLHSIAMYAPGFFTGRIIQRLGHHACILMGGVLTIACAALSITSPSFAHFALALMLLGLGWNLMFTATSALLATGFAAGERVRAQLSNDVVVFGTVALTSLSSGALFAGFGWGAVNAAVVPPVLAALALVAWHRAQTRRVALA
jgi:MFS family permease